MQLPFDFLNRMQENLSEAEYDSYLKEMEKPAVRALRVNTLKTSPERLFSLTGFHYRKTDINPDGFLIEESDAIGKNPFHCAGLFYMQEPSAQYPAILLNPKPYETVLDLCAAPGGKTGQLASMMENRGILIANEPVPSRTKVLESNVERLGIRNAVITGMFPEKLCPMMKGCCDAVLVDAPCSGEGMFRKEPKAVSEWSVAHVKACAERQRNILNEAVTCVKPGGRLVYSTCTFSKDENEDNVYWFLQANPSFELVSMKRLYPFNSDGEGQFAALFVKKNNFSEPDEPQKTNVFPVKEKKIKNKRPDDASLAAAKFFSDETFLSDFDVRFRSLPDGRVNLCETDLPEYLTHAHIQRAYLSVGEYKNGRFLPSHALYMAFPSDSFRQHFEPTHSELTRFLRGEEIVCPKELSGYTAVSVSGYNVGFGKASMGKLKNHLPKGLRIN